MATSNTPFLGIELPVPGSAEPFRVADVNAAFTVIDNWAENTNTEIEALPKISVQQSQPASPVMNQIWMW